MIQRCLHCSAGIETDATHCANCGKPVPGQPVDYPETWPNYKNGPDAPLRTDELLAYADESGRVWGDGRSHDAYLKKWNGLLEGRSSWAGVNWPALLFGFNWCIWRKLYLAGVLLIVAQIVAGILIAFVLVLVTGRTDPTDPLLESSSFIGMAAVRITFALAANTYYLERARNAIVALRPQAPDHDALLTQLRARGGTSASALAIALMISFTILVWNYYASITSA